MSAEGSAPDALALILGAGGAAMSALLGLVVALVGARAKHLEGKVSELEKAHNLLWVGATSLDGRQKTTESEVASLKRDTLTREIFDMRIDDQNSKLDKLENRVERVGRDLVARPTRSETGMLAVRPAPRVDERRDSDDPPPMRPRLPSRRGE